MISIEQPPSGTDQSLKAYLVRMFKVVGIAIDSAWILQPTNRKIDGKDGMLTYFSEAIPGTDIVDPGLYFYMDKGWKKVTLG